MTSQPSIPSPDLLEHPKVKQTLTSVDEKYWYPFGYKVEVHSVTCQSCGTVERSTSIYKVFAHYLYSPHTSVHKLVPVGGDHNVYAAALPVHFVNITSQAPICGLCVESQLEFTSDSDWRIHLRTRAAEITQAARRSNELRDIFGGPPARKAPPSTQAAPKVSLSDFLKGM